MIFLQLLGISILLGLGFAGIVILVILLFFRRRKPVDTIDLYEEMARSIEVDTRFYNDDTPIF
jgi:hypothetical protein